MSKMKRNRALLGLLGVAGVASCTPYRPNILLILADDYGPMDTGVTGSNFYETPNLDRIANCGVHFTDGYAAATVSSPTRASLMTGLYTPRHGVTDWIGAPSGEAWRNEGWCNRLLPADYEHNLDTKRFKCLPQALKDAGYSTFMAGKWHLGDVTTPEMAGFEINKGGYKAGQPKGGYFSPYNNPKLEDGPDGENLSMRLAQETVSFIEDNLKSPGRKPFFAFLSFYATHIPVETTKENWEYFRDKASRMQHVPDSAAFVVDRNFPVCRVQDNPVFAGLIRQMDDATGYVTDALDRLGIRKNTIVIFMSDNGGLASLGFYSTSNYPFRGGKSYQWEGGIRIPFFVHVPGVEANGSVDSTPVNTIDIYPTLLDYAGIEIPDGLDGMSLRPVLEGKKLEERPMFWHYPHYGGSGGDPSSIVREGQWKLILYHEDMHCELYNLENDPGELEDVSSKYPETLARLRKTLEDWLVEADAVMPVEDTSYSEKAHEEFLERFRKEVFMEQTANRRMRLNPEWAPGPDWWGSKPVND